jgi:hypothetical protein
VPVRPHRGAAAQRDAPSQRRCERLPDESHENLRRYVLPSLGHRPLASITRADGRLLITTSREKGLRLNTVKGIARTLSTLLSQAVEDDKLPANPCLRMGRYLRRGDEPEMVI